MIRSAIVAAVGAKGECKKNLIPNELIKQLIFIEAGRMPSGSLISVNSSNESILLHTAANYEPTCEFVSCYRISRELYVLFIRKKFCRIIVIAVDFSLFILLLTSTFRMDWSRIIQNFKLHSPFFVFIIILSSCNKLLFGKRRDFVTLISIV